MPNETFEVVPGFCPDCGAILPPLGGIGGIQCFACNRKFPATVFDNSKVSYTIYFNSRDVYEQNNEKVKMEKTEKGEEPEEGPVVERKCPNCGNERMSYATLQLRSADEGQTVFYTCTKCKFKETENS